MTASDNYVSWTAPREPEVPRSFWISVFLCAAQFLCFSAEAMGERCGLKDVKDVIEDGALAYLQKIYRKRTAQGPVDMGSSTETKFYNVGTKILELNYDVGLSEMYQISESADVKLCDGKLTMSLPDGAAAWNSFKYQVINTEDGKLVVRWEGDSLTDSIFKKLVDIEFDRY